MSLAVVCGLCGKVGPVTSMVDGEAAYALVQDWYLSGNDYCPDCEEWARLHEED